MHSKSRSVDESCIRLRRASISLLTAPCPDTTAAQLEHRGRRFVPDPCQILRGTTGNTGEPGDRPPGADTAPPQVRPGASPRCP